MCWYCKWGSPDWRYGQPTLKPNCEPSCSSSSTWEQTRNQVPSWLRNQKESSEHVSAEESECARQLHTLTTRKSRNLFQSLWHADWKLLHNQQVWRTHCRTHPATLDRHLSWSSWFATTSLTSAFTWTRTFEWILRGLWDAHRCFTSSHQDQWWLSCACALHFLATNCLTRMSQSSSTTILVPISFHSHSAFPSPSTSFPRSPLHEYTLNASRPSQLYFRQCYLVTGIYPLTPRRCLYCWLLSSLTPSTCEHPWSHCISFFFNSLWN